MPLGFGAGCGGYAPGWPPSSTDRAFRWTPSPTKSGAAESIDIEQAAGAGDFRPLARLSLREVVPARPGPLVRPDAAQPARCEVAARLVDRFSAGGLPAQPARSRRRVTAQSGGSAASSAVVISGASPGSPSRPRVPDRRDPDGHPWGSSASSSSEMPFPRGMTHPFLHRLNYPPTRCFNLPPPGMRSRPTENVSTERQRLWTL